MARENRRAEDVAGSAGMRPPIPSGHQDGEAVPATRGESARHPIPGSELQRPDSSATAAVLTRGREGVRRTIGDLS